MNINFNNYTLYNNELIDPSQIGGNPAGINFS
jgi:hypothetical protein